MMLAERRHVVDTTHHDLHECHKRHQRDQSLIRVLRRELEAARDSIDELEREIALLEATALPM